MSGRVNGKVAFVSGPVCGIDRGTPSRSAARAASVVVVGIARHGR
jgi:hypothetical protein